MAARIGGPLAKNRFFFFGGYEALVERLGNTISTVVPDDNARLGILPTGVVGVNPPSRRTLPSTRAPTAALGQGLAVYDFPFDQTPRPAVRAGPPRLQRRRRRGQLFARYTFDDTDQFLPTDYPQFPRQFLSRNQFFTGEYREMLSSTHAQHRAAELQPHPHRSERRGQHRRSRWRHSCPAAT